MSDNYQEKELSVLPPLDNEIVDADELVVSFYAELDKIDASKTDLEKQCTEHVKSLDRKLADYVASLNKELKERERLLDEKIASAVSSLSFDPALKNQILGFRGGLERLAAQQSSSKLEYEDIESTLREMRDSTSKLGREIQNMDNYITKKSGELGDSDLAKGCGCAYLGCSGFILIGAFVSNELIKVFPGWLIVFVLPLAFALALFYAPFIIKKAIRRKTIASLKEQIEICEQQQQAIRNRQEELSRGEDYIRQEIKKLTASGESELRKKAQPRIQADKEKKEQAQREAEEKKQQAQRTAEKNTLRKYDELVQKRDKIIAKFQEDWNTSVQTLLKIVEEIQSSQPSLDRLAEKGINSSGTLSELLVSGLLHITLPAGNSLKKWQMSVPNLLDFPFVRPIFDEYRAEYKEASDSSPLHRLLLRLLFTLPVGMLEITVIDPLQMGRSLAPFLPLADIEKIVPHKHFLTVSDEIEVALKKLFDYANELMQKRFHSNVADWASYNGENPDKRLPYKLLFIFGFPEQCSDKGILYLKRLIEFGPRCGILPIITIDYSKIDPKRAERVANEIPSLLEKNGQKIYELYSSSRFRLKKLKVTEENEQFPSYSVLCNALDTIKSDYSQHSKSGKKIMDMWLASDYNQTSIREISAPIGWRMSDGNEISLQLGGVNTEHHVLLAGRSGSGKSNLLHVLIHGFLDRYSPDELNVYLLDYKQGTEFNVYANPTPPQIKLVATESDTEYGITVLSHLADELVRRSNIFKQCNARDFKEYREKTTDILPRILLIIDEFQMMFQENDVITKQADTLFNKLLRQGRAYGIHVLLATQTLRGLQSTTSVGQLISQIGCRIALACNQEDSALILATSNCEAAELKSPPEAIINNQSGQKSGNCKFNIPHANDEDCAKHLYDIINETQKKGFTADTKIFNGAHLPAIPVPQWFANVINNNPSQIVLGEQLNFNAQPFVFQWERRMGNNLCVAGIDDTIRYGILRSVLFSIQQGKNFNRVIYYNSYPQEPKFDLSKEFGDIEIHKHDDWDCDIKDLISELKNKQTLLIIDSLDNATKFIPQGSNYGQKKADTVNHADSLKTLLDEGPQLGSFVLAFVDNWKRFNNVYKSYVSNFEMFIGFQLNEDDASSLASGGSIGGNKVKGLDKPNKAIFINRQRNVQTMFRPFSKTD